MAALVAASIAACGGDDELSNEELDKPPLTVPQDESADDTTGTSTDETDATETSPDAGGGAGDPPADTAPDEPLDQPNSGNGGVPAPDSNDAPADDPPRDSPENDTPPEPGSPEERFEQFCTENPGAC